MTQEAEVISIETVHKHPWITWEECMSVKVWKRMPCITWLLHYGLIVHAHWAICLAYYPIYFVVVVVGGLIDSVINVAIWCCKFLCWAGKKAWALLVHLYLWLMDVAGESIKAFLKSLLKWLGVAIAIYAVYIFIKSGMYLKIFDMI